MNTSKLALFIGTIILAALAMTGCSDSNSDSTLTAIDTAPPAVPTALYGVLNRSTDTVTLTWSPNVTDSDFSGFKLQRVVDDTATNLIAAPTNVTTYTDNAPSATSWSYQLVAIDASGNESAYTEVIMLAETNEDGTNLGE